MYNFGDEFTIESYRVPWLVWIQVLVMVLLLILLYCFGLLVLDLSDENTSAVSTGNPSSSTSRLLSDHLTNPTTTVLTNRLQNTQVGDSLKGEIVGSTSRIMRRQDTVEMEASLSTSTTATTAGYPPHLYYHPCFYFRLARIAFLKCLGLDSTTSENSSTPQRGKRKES